MFVLIKMLRRLHFQGPPRTTSLFPGVKVIMALAMLCDCGTGWERVKERGKRN